MFLLLYNRCSKGDMKPYFFNLKTLEEASCNNSNEFMLRLWYHCTKRLPKNDKHLKYVKPNLHGTSFLLNPQALFDDKNTDILYKVQYVKLAARRDYLLYEQYAYKGLQTSFFPDLIYDSIKYNPLLEITKTDILFKFER